MSQTLLRPVASGQTRLVQHEIALTLVQASAPGMTRLTLMQRGKAPALSLKPLQAGSTTIKSAVTGPRGGRGLAGEGIDNFSGDPEMVYRLYAGS